MFEGENRRLPDIFESFSEARRQGFIAMKNLKEQGKGVVGTFCSYVPMELFLAADLVPLGLYSASAVIHKRNNSPRMEWRQRSSPASSTSPGRITSRRPRPR
jgi:hypothetical protein